MTRIYNELQNACPIEDKPFRVVPYLPVGITLHRKMKIEVQRMLSKETMMKQVPCIL